MTLRDYQAKGRVCIFNEWEDVIATLVVMPTGTGKTVLFASVIEQAQPRRALVVAHREELIWQAREKIEALTNLQCEIEMADLWAGNSLFNNTPVVITTVQTQNSALGDRTRMSRFKPEDFGVLIIDEAHHATAKSYQNLIHYYRQNPNLRVLGVTATPDRADEEALGKVFDTVAFDYEVLDAIHDGWLVPIQQQFVHISGLDFSDIKTTAGDLNGGQLAELMETENNLQGVASASIEIIGNRRAIVFTASVKQAEVVSEIFNRHRNGMADWVCGATNKDKRRLTLQNFKSNQTQVVVNCGVLTEGFDDPGVECIIMARPTKSRSLYAQMCGRSTRPLAGVVDGLVDAEARKTAIAASPKPNCLIVDFVGNSGRHKLMTSADILGGNVSEDAINRALAKAKKAGGPVDMSKELDDAEDEIKRNIEERQKLEAARRARLVAKASYTTRNVNPFDILDMRPVTSRGWDTGKVLSEKQRMVLLKQGIDPSDMPFAQAKQLLNEMFRRWNNKECSFGQAKVLKRFGLPNKVSREQASHWLDAISKNQWRLPATLLEKVQHGR